MSAVLIDEGVGGVPDPPKAVPFGCGSVKQLDVVKDRLGGVFKEDLTVTILGRGGRGGGERGEGGMKNY